MTPPGQNDQRGHDAEINHGASDGDTERCLEIIAHSDDLKARLVEAPSDAHRAAIVDIHAYLELLESITHLDSETLKDRLGCKKNVNELPDCSLGELHRSRNFLSFASEAVLAVEFPPEVAVTALGLAVETFRRVYGDNQLARYVFSKKAVLECIAEGKIEEAAEQVRLNMERGYIECFTGSGDRVLLDPALMSGLSRAALSSPYPESLISNNE